MQQFYVQQIWAIREDNLKNENNLKNEDNPKNENNFKNKGNFKNEDDLRHGGGLKKRWYYFPFSQLALTTAPCGHL